jgi:hypothetical protein
MTGLYIFGGLIIAGVIVLFVFRARWSKANRIEEQIRSARIEKSRSDEAEREAARAAVVKDS